MDWANVAEEIEDVGLSELHSVESFLNLILLHLLKLYASPNCEACNPSRGGITAFRNNAKWRFAPSMRHRIDVDTLYAEAVGQLMEIDSTLKLPPDNLLTLDHLLNGDTRSLLARLPLTP